MLPVILILAGIAAIVQPIQADPGNGAVVIKDTGCAMLDANGNPGILASSDQSVITPHGNGKMTCKATGVDNPSGKVVRLNFDNTGIKCGTPAGLTEKWQEIISASGEATLQCHMP